MNQFRDKVLGIGYWVLGIAERLSSMVFVTFVSPIRNTQYAIRVNTPYPIRVKSQRGFTLIELLVVLGIIGLLAGLVVASVATARAKARDNTRQTDLAAVATALELYRSQYKRYPIVDATSSDTWRDLQSALAPYLPNWPTEPSGNGDGQFAVGYWYMMNSVGSAGAEEGERYLLDVMLERDIADSALTAPGLAVCQVVVQDQCAFQTGTYRTPYNGRVHYRLAR